MQRSETTPIPKDKLLDERETHIEYRKSRKKVLHKDNWRTEKKRFSDKMEEFWKGKTVYKIKKDYVIPEDVVRSDTDRQAKLFRGNIDDLFHPESASSSKPVSVQKKPGSRQREAGKKLLRGPGLRQVEVGPAPEKRNVGKQKPVLADEGSSKRKESGCFRSWWFVKMSLIGLPRKWVYNQMMNLKSLHPNLLLLHMLVVSKIQQVKLRN